MESDIKEQIKQRLTTPLPGLPAQMRMAPLPRRGLIGASPGHLREAAVLLMLYRRRGDLSVILTVRPHSVQHHRGQVSFPGGAREGDESAEENALREAEEEVGISPKRVEILGRLSPLPVHASGFVVQPVVGWHPDDPAFLPDRREVAEILEPTLSRLTRPETAIIETWQIRDVPRQVPFFLIDHHKVWGATAMMLSEFMAVLRRPPALQPSAGKRAAGPS